MLKVMIVDNEAIIRKGLSLCINWQSLGCEVVATAEDGVEALRTLEQCPVDIVFTDIRMPGLDGLALASEIHKRFSHTKVIIITGFSEFEYVQSALRHHVADFIVKPTNEEKICAAVQRAKTMLLAEQNAEALQQTMEQQEKHNHQLQQILFLQRLLDDRLSSTPYLAEQSRRLNLDFSSYFVLDCMPTLPDGAEAQQAIAFAKDASEFFTHVFDAEKMRILFRGEMGFLVILFQIQPQVLREQLEEYVRLINTVTEYNIQIGVSSQCHDASRMAQAAKEAADAQRYLFLDRGRSFVFFEHIPTLSVACQEQLLDLLRHIDGALQYQNISELRQSMQQFESIVRANRISFSEVRSFITIVYNLCTGMLLNYDKRAVLSSNKLVTLDQLLAMLKPQDLVSGVLHMANQAFASLKGDLTETGDLIHFVCNYINAHYAQELTLESLSEMAHLSPSYLSRLFKRSKGKNISSYIQDVRIEKSKEMLRLSNLKAYEISQAVGIDDPVYFSRLFKKLTGCKPMDYRRMYLSSKDFSDGVPADPP